MAACRHDGDDEAGRAVPTNARVVLEDDFSDPATDWYTGDDPDSLAEYRDGEYRVLVKDTDWFVSFSYNLEEVVEALRVEVDAVQTTGTADDEVGVICYAHVSADQVVGYTLTISPDGSAYVTRDVEDETTELVTRTGEDAIRPLGRPNRLRAECVGATREEPAVVVFRVNGARVARVEDDEGFPLFDGVGITAYSSEGRSESLYDNLAVNELH